MDERRAVCPKCKKFTGKWEVYGTAKLEPVMGEIGKYERFVLIHTCGGQVILNVGSD
jgi:hypothetical protein